jgi:hypothetical protein
MQVQFLTPARLEFREAVISYNREKVRTGNAFHRGAYAALPPLRPYNKPLG